MPEFVTKYIFNFLGFCYKALISWYYLPVLRPLLVICCELPLHVMENPSPSIEGQKKWRLNIFFNYTIFLYK